MQAASFEEVLEQILAKETRYQRDAYLFMKDALDYTRKSITKGKSKSHVGHVSPQELLSGIREYALETFGPMVITVLEEWGIRSCHDFGAIVFIMVDHSLFAKTEKDTMADFESGYDFDEAFRLPFLPKGKILKRLPEPGIA